MQGEKQTISAVVLTRDEAKNIVECLSLLRWCDEVILIDGSQDSTVEKARTVIDPGRLRVVREKGEDDFSALRNQGLHLASSQWVLFVDADHRVSDALRREIMKVITHRPQAAVAFRIRQRDWFSGRKLMHGETAHTEHILLGKKTAGSWRRRVHEVWMTEGKVQTLRTPIDHYPHQTIEEFIDHITRWSALDAKAMHEEGRRMSPYEIISYPIAKYVFNWVFRLGFLDGFPGFVYAFMMSMHSLCVRVTMLTS